MASKSVSYTEARANLAALWDRAIDDREPVVLHRRGKEDVALVAASELQGLYETMHLLNSPRNAERLLGALARSREHGGAPSTVAELRAELGLKDG